MELKRWRRNGKLLISNFSLIICFGLWGIKIITLPDCIKKGINSLIDNFLNNFFLFRRHYIQLIFKWSQSLLLPLRSNALLIIKGRGGRITIYRYFLSRFRNQWYKISRKNVIPNHPRWCDQNLLFTHFHQVSLVEDFRRRTDKSVINTSIMQSFPFYSKWQRPAAHPDLSEAVFFAAARTNTSEMPQLSRRSPTCGELSALSLCFQ